MLINGPRAAGRTTTARQHAPSEVRLDQPVQAAAFQADPDAALRGRPEPVLLDEWQAVPEVLGAVKRSVDDDPRPGRFILTGSVRADLETEMWPGTGRLVRTRLFGFTERELAPEGPRGEEPLFVDRLATGDMSVFARPKDVPDLRDYVECALRGGFPGVALAPQTSTLTWADSYLEQLLTRGSIRLVGDRDEFKLVQYFEALAASSAVVPEHKTLYDTAGINRKTAAAHDRLLEALPGRRVVALEVKAAGAPTVAHAKHLAWFRDQLGDRFLAGAVVHTGPDLYELGDRLVALPIWVFWA